MLENDATCGFEGHVWLFPAWAQAAVRLNLNPRTEQAYITRAAIVKRDQRAIKVARRATGFTSLSNYRDFEKQLPG